MIIDYKANPDFAKHYAVWDVTTGECLDFMGIVFADDEKGLIRRHLRADGRNAYLAEPDPDHPGEKRPKVIEKHRPIKILPRGEQFKGGDS